MSYTQNRAIGKTPVNTGLEKSVLLICRVIAKEFVFYAR